MKGEGWTASDVAEEVEALWNLDTDNQESGMTCCSVDEEVLGFSVDGAVFIATFERIA